jgi:hypothetical protein
MASGRYSVTLVDFNGATNTVSFDGVVINASNYADQLTAQIGLQDALLPIVDGRIRTSVVGATHNHFPNVKKSDDPESQIGNAWKLAYQDTVTGGIETFKIRTANQELAVNQYVNGQMISILPLDAGAGLAFKNAFEGYQRSSAGNPVTLLTVELIS